MVVLVRSCRHGHWNWVRCFGQEFLPSCLGEKVQDWVPHFVLVQDWVLHFASVRDWEKHSEEASRRVLHCEQEQDWVLHFGKRE